eukprot:UN13081
MKQMSTKLLNSTKILICHFIFSLIYCFSHPLRHDINNNFPKPIPSFIMRRSPFRYFKHIKITIFLMFFF